MDKPFDLILHFETMQEFTTFFGQQLGAFYSVQQTEDVPEILIEIFRKQLDQIITFSCLRYGADETLVFIEKLVIGLPDIKMPSFEEIKKYWPNADWDSLSKQA